jgi:hypothetical protein
MKKAPNGLPLCSGCKHGKIDYDKEPCKSCIEGKIDSYEDIEKCT